MRCNDSISVKYVARKAVRDTLQVIDAYTLRREKMELAIALLLIILVLDIVALRWGHDSRDSLESAEWERRKGWYLLTPAHHD